MSHGLASKLNSWGIQLARDGRGREALNLYSKAHRVVSTDLRHKISLNAAIACWRMCKFQTALKYAERARSEHGSDFPKLKKLRLNIQQKLAKKAT